MEKPKGEPVRARGFITAKLESRPLDLLHSKRDSQQFRIRQPTTPKEIAPVAPRGDEGGRGSEDVFEATIEVVSFILLPEKGNTILLCLNNKVCARPSISHGMEKLSVAITLLEPFLFGATLPQDFLVRNNLFESSLELVSKLHLAVRQRGVFLQNIKLLDLGR